MPEFNVDGINILMVDDSEDDIHMVQQTFKHLHLLNLVKVAKDGEEAMKYLEPNGTNPSTLPGLILLDINMPVMDGFEFLQLIKANEKLQHIPVAILTTSNREEDIVKSFRYGACSFIRKPVMLEGLIKIMKEFELYWTLVSKRPSL